MKKFQTNLKKAEVVVKATNRAKASSKKAYAEATTAKDEAATRATIVVAKLGILSI